MEWNGTKQTFNEVEQLTCSVIYLGGYIARCSMHMRSHLIIDSTPGTNYWLCCNIFNSQFSLTNQPFCTQVYVSHIRTSNTNAD